MHKSTLIEIFRTFSKEEVNRFGDFTESPFHNKNSNVIKLYASLKRFFPEFTSAQLTKEIQWEILFPGKKYNYGVMKNVIFDLTKLAEEYLANNQSGKDRVYNNNLIAELRKRNLVNLHRRKIDKLSSKIEKLTKDEDYYISKLQLNQELLNISIDKKLSDSINVESMGYELNLFMLRLFAHTLNLYIEEQRTNIRHSNHTALYFLEYFTGNIEEFKNEEVLLIYYYLLVAATNPDSGSNYTAARDFIKRNLHLLDYTDQWNINNALVTIVLKKKSLYPDKAEEYMQELLRLSVEKIKLIDEHGTGSIDILTYRNVLVLFLNRNDKTGLEDFVRKYLRKVDIQELKSVEHYSNAFIFFAEGDFKKCLEFCSKLNFKDLFDSVKESYWFKNDIKSLEVKCFYELGLYENFTTTVDSYRHFLASTPLMNGHSKENELNFINLLNRLFILKINGNSPGIVELSRELESNNKISGKTWLLEKTKESIALLHK